MVPIDTSDRGTSMGDNSVRLTRSSGAGGRSSWSATDVERDREHPRNILIEIPDLARDPGLLCDTDALGVDVVGQASRAVSRGTLDSSVPQVVKSTRFCSRVYHRFALMEKDGTFIKQPYHQSKVGHDHDHGQPSGRNHQGRGAERREVRNET